MKFTHETRVQHTTWTDRHGNPQRGTVRVIKGENGHPDTAEVQWDHSSVADELELVEKQLIVLQR